VVRPRIREACSASLEAIERYSWNGTHLNQKTHQFFDGPPSFSGTAPRPFRWTCLAAIARLTARVASKCQEALGRQRIPLKCPEEESHRYCECVFEKTGGTPCFRTNPHGQLHARDNRTGITITSAYRDRCAPCTSIAPARAPLWRTRSRCLSLPRASERRTALAGRGSNASSAGDRQLFARGLPKHSLVRAVRPEMRLDPIAFVPTTTWGEADASRRTIRQRDPAILFAHTNSTKHQ